MHVFAHNQDSWAIMDQKIGQPLRSMRKGRKSEVCKRNGNYALQFV
jgi:hypothetical protein